MPDDATLTRPTICLTMIVRDEAHIIHEALDSAAPHIDRWVVVDTGSTDDTVAVIERRMAAHGVPGEIHHRPWRDFGANRTESLQLAAGQADYLWVLDADDLVTGDLDLTRLESDSYLLRYRAGHAFWRRQIFRGSLPWRYEGVLHEYPVCDAPATEERLDGAYEIHGRTMGARSTDPGKYARDAELLRGVVERDPDDLRALFYLGQSLADAGEDAEAAEVFARRAAAGGWDEERCHSLMRRAECLLRLDEPWALALESYLDAFEARPTRAEPFARIARRYREAGAFALGHDFARRAAEMPFPTADNLFVDDSVYAWGARDEQAVCGYHTGRYAEALDLGTALLAGTTLPDEQRERVAGNRDSCVGFVRESRTAYPPEVAGALSVRLAAPATAGADLTVTLAAHDAAALERTLNSFLHCCEDLDRVARVVCLVEGIPSGETREVLIRHPYLELLRDPSRPAAAERADVVDRLLAVVRTPLWLHLEAGWELFSRSPIVDRAARILAADETIVQVALNRSHAVALTDRSLPGGEVRTAGDVRYLLRAEADPPHVAGEPSVLDVGRLRAATATRPQDLVASGLRAASFDEVACLGPVPPAGTEDPAPAVEPTVTPAPDVPDAPRPPMLVDLAPDVRVGELSVDVDPPWPFVSASVLPSVEGVRLRVRTAVHDAEPLDYEVVLGSSLQLESLRSVPVEGSALGPCEVELDGGLLRLQETGDGAARLTLRRDGSTTRFSVPFSLAGADEERPFALVRLPDQLLVVFGIHGERLALAILELDTVRDLLAG